VGVALIQVEGLPLPGQVVEFSLFDGFAQSSSIFGMERLSIVAF
jgi:hypothetical protein